VRADTFIFKSIKDFTAGRSGRDTIFDFSIQQNGKISLSAIDANVLKKGNQAFEFIGPRDFSGRAGSCGTGRPPATGMAQGRGFHDPLRRSQLTR